MSKIFSEQLSQDFERVFGWKLSHFSNPFYGFDVIKFEKVLVPENITSDGKNLNDHMSEKFGAESLTIIDRILAEEKANVNPSTLNENLKHIQGGIITYQCHYLKPTPLYPNRTFEVSGQVFYPFGIRQNGNKWQVDHLPSGTLVVTYKTKKDCLKLVEKVLESGFDFDAIYPDETAINWLKEQL